MEIRRPLRHPLRRLLINHTIATETMQPRPACNAGSSIRWAPGPAYYVSSVVSVLIGHFDLRYFQPRAIMGNSRSTSIAAAHQANQDRRTRTGGPGLQQSWVIHSQRALPQQPQAIQEPSDSGGTLLRFHLRSFSLSGQGRQQIHPAWCTAKQTDLVKAIAKPHAANRREHRDNSEATRKQHSAQAALPRYCWIGCLHIAHLSPRQD